MATKKQEGDNEHELTDQVSEKAHDVIDRAAASIAEAEERIRREAAEAGEKVHAGKDKAQVRAEDVLGSVAGYVRENPLTSLGIAFVAGSLFSALTRKR